MSHPFDATLKDIVGRNAADFIPVLHLPADLPFRPINIDLSTVSAATDVALGFGEPLEQIVDINFQSGPDARLPSRLLLYSAAYFYHHAVPVRSIVILLRPTANLATLTGTLSYQAGESRLEFRYEVNRLWEQPVAPFLRGGLALLPLAPLCPMPAGLPLEEALKEVVHQIDQRLASDTSHAQAVQLMTATFVLTGLVAGQKALSDIFRGVKIMHESSAFDLYEEKGRQKGLNNGPEGYLKGWLEGYLKGWREGWVEGWREGRIDGAHCVLLHLGQRRFGPLDAATEAALRAVRDFDRLKRMAAIVDTTQSWSDLLATR